MAVSMRDLDPAFQGAGQKAYPLNIQHDVSLGIYVTFYLKTTALKSGALHHDIHYWLGKDTSQDESGTAALKTVELDAALGGRAVQYREVQGHETEKFLSYFKPCIIPQVGGVASGFKHAVAEEHTTRLVNVGPVGFGSKCASKQGGFRLLKVKLALGWSGSGRIYFEVDRLQVPFARSSLNHDDIFILDTKSKIFQFSGSNSSIQERAKALEVVQYIKDTYHDGKCEIAAIEDGKLMADAETGEFWGFFGGFAPLPRKTASNDAKSNDALFPTSNSLFRVENGRAESTETDTLTRELLETNKCYILDCGAEVYVWMGRNTSLDERKSASGAAEELVRGHDRPKYHITRVIEGFETVMFRSVFDSWPQSTDVAVSEDGRGKVAALLKRQGINVKGLLKAAPAKEEPLPYIDCSGNLQVWRVNGQEKTLLPTSDQSKFYSGDCYIFQYSYPGEDIEEYLVGTWFGKQSIEEDRSSATSQASKIVESLKFLPAQARVFEGDEPILFFSIFQSFIVFKGGLSDGYKKYIAEKELPDETYTKDGIALFRVQGSGPENMQSIQVEPRLQTTDYGGVIFGFGIAFRVSNCGPTNGKKLRMMGYGRKVMIGFGVAYVASSLNSSYCYILHSDSTVFTWFGNLTTSENQELVERQLDLIKPSIQSKPQKEGTESEQFWDLLCGKSEYPSQKIGRDAESDPHLFSCTFLKGDLKVTEIYNFNQDDLMTEDVFILDCHSEIFVWVGQQVDPKNRALALTIGEKFLNRDFLLEKLSIQAPIYIVMEGSEPQFFTRFFTWDSAKSAMHGNSFQRKLAILKNGVTPAVDLNLNPDKNACSICGLEQRESIREQEREGKPNSIPIQWQAAYT
ncbi:hypothetical protein LguiA_026086 [Lonicera macranthoides]